MVDQTARDKSKIVGTTNDDTIVRYSSGLKRDRADIDSDSSSQGEFLPKQEILQLAANIRKRMHWRVARLAGQKNGHNAGNGVRRARTTRAR